MTNGDLVHDALLDDRGHLRPWSELTADERGALESLGRRDEFDPGGDPDGFQDGDA